MVMKGVGSPGELADTSCIDEWVFRKVAMKYMKSRRPIKWLWMFTGFGLSNSGLHDLLVVRTGFIMDIYTVSRSVNA